MCTQHIDFPPTSNLILTAPAVVSLPLSPVLPRPCRRAASPSPRFAPSLLGANPTGIGARNIPTPHPPQISSPPLRQLSDPHLRLSLPLAYTWFTCQSDVHEIGSIACFPPQLIYDSPLPPTCNVTIATIIAAARLPPLSLFVHLLLFVPGLPSANLAGATFTKISTATMPKVFCRMTASGPCPSSPLSFPTGAGHQPHVLACCVTSDSHTHTSV